MMNSGKTINSGIDPDTYTYLDPEEGLIQRQTLLDTYFSREELQKWAKLNNASIDIETN